MYINHLIILFVISHNVISILFNSLSPALPQRTCYPVMGCDDNTLSNGLMTTVATTDDDCCSQPNVISVLQAADTTCVLCKFR